MNSKCVQGGFRLLRGALVAVIVAAALAKGAFAGPLEDGVAAYSRGDFATALRLLRPLAENGNAYAQYSLGFMYRTAYDPGADRGGTEAGAGVEAEA